MQKFFDSFLVVFLATFQLKTVLCCAKKEVKFKFGEIQTNKRSEEELDMRRK